MEGAQTTNQQGKERRYRLLIRNFKRGKRESLRRRARRWSWIRPWLQACRQLQSYPFNERLAVSHFYIPLQRLPRALQGDATGNSGLNVYVRTGRGINWERPEEIEDLQDKSDNPEIQGSFPAQIEVERNLDSKTMANVAPSVPIAIQMGAVGDRTTSVAPLPVFSGWPGSDPDQHLAQFLTACVANNGRTEDVWLRWLPATLKDTAFE